MNSEEVQTRLAGYLPELYDDSDPEIADALRLARADPELSAWLDQQIEFDRKFASALRSAPASRRGVETLLRNAEREQRKASLLRRVPARILWAAAAAVLVAGALVVKYQFYPPAVEFPTLTQAPEVSDFRDHMAFFANQRFTLDMSTSDLAEARAWLEQRQFPIYAETPATLQQFRALGCREIDWDGERVSLLCFLNDKREIVHLFVTDRGGLGNAGSGELAQLQRVRGLETRGWQDDSRVFLLVGSKPKVSLAGLL